MKIFPFSWSKRRSTKDMIYPYQSKWSIYNFSTTTKKGLWQQFEEKILELYSQNLIKDLSENEMNDFLDKNPDIEFEITFFKKSLTEIFFLKMNKEIYCYTTSPLKIKMSPKIDVRFYFDFKKFLAL
jgi:hypothetical protein